MNYIICTQRRNSIKMNYLLDNSLKMNYNILVGRL